jgi:hypothetical protein
MRIMRDVPEHLRKNLKKCIIMVKKGAIKEEEETSDMEESDEEKGDKEKGVKEEGVKEGEEGVDEDIRNGSNHQEDSSLLTMSIQPPPLPPNYEEFFPLVEFTLDFKLPKHGIEMGGEEGLESVPAFEKYGQHQQLSEYRS